MAYTSSDGFPPILSYGYHIYNIFLEKEGFFSGKQLKLLRVCLRVKAIGPELLILTL